MRDLLNIDALQIPYSHLGEHCQGTVASETGFPSIAGPPHFTPLSLLSVFTHPVKL
jgi:hypothetical protein